MKKILVIEDEAAIAQLEKDYLELSDFQVEIEPDGSEGLKKALTGEYDVIILELILPGTDGFEICRKFREQYLTPVVLVSPKKEDIDVIRGLALGADDYVTKPFSPSEMVARVKAHLNRYEILTDSVSKKEERNDVITIGEVKLDQTARRVFIGEEEKSFTTKEFDLLRFFVLNPNHVFSKEELFEEVWGPDPAADTATVTVHIKKIREKIEQDTSNPEYIETVWGKGYRFKE